MNGMIGIITIDAAAIWAMYTKNRSGHWTNIYAWVRVSFFMCNRRHGDVATSTEEEKQQNKKKGDDFTHVQVRQNEFVLVYFMLFV